MWRRRWWRRQILDVEHFVYIRDAFRYAVLFLIHESWLLESLSCSHIVRAQCWKLGPWKKKVYTRVKTLYIYTTTIFTFEETIIDNECTKFRFDYSYNALHSAHFIYKVVGLVFEKTVSEVEVFSIHKTASHSHPWDPHNSTRTASIPLAQCYCLPCLAIPWWPRPSLDTWGE